MSKPIYFKLKIWTEFGEKFDAIYKFDPPYNPDCRRSERTDNHESLYKNVMYRLRKEWFEDDDNQYFLETGELLQMPRNKTIRSTYLLGEMMPEDYQVPSCTDRKEKVEEKPKKKTVKKKTEK